jgi:spore germination protein KC
MEYQMNLSSGRIKKAIFCILSIFYLAGCWDIREINEIGFVMAAGVDKAKDSDKFVVTVQLANPKPIAAEKGKAAQGEPIWVLSAEGRTIFEAVRELSLVSSRRIVWGHNYIVIIGQSLAENNIGPVIDFFRIIPNLE